MIDSYIFGFLLSKINVNLFVTSGPIKEFKHALNQKDLKMVKKYFDKEAVSFR